jgi:hypothetical protein
MAVDISLCITNEMIAAEQIARSTAIIASSAEHIYVVAGTALTVCDGRHFFGLWASGSVDVQQLCAELSLFSSPVCIAWKAEHGSVGGYIIFADGKVQSDVAEEGGDYLLLPGLGIEAAFGITLELPNDDRLFFPELLLDGELTCTHIEGSSKQISRLPDTVVLELLEGDIEASPVLPVVDD